MRRTGPLEAPLLRVSRPVSACSRCRAAKIKVWSYSLSSSYVASLESRVEKLERRLAYARSRKESVAMHEADEPPSEPPDRKDSLATIRAAIHGKAARRREAADVNELVSDFGFLSVDATTRDFETATTNMTFARLVLAATMNEPVPKEKTFQLPPRPSAIALVQYYLDNVFALYPMFPETALFNSLDAVYQVNGRPVTDFEHWLLFMVLAIASMAQSRTRTDPFYVDGIAWVGRALKYSDKVLMPGYIAQIQALVLLVQYSMLDPAHFDGWQLIGFACRAIVDLGFHQDAPKEQQPDKKVLEQRRKIFYCVYSLDRRSISMAHFRAFSFADDTANVAFPSMAVTIINDLSKPMAGPHSLETALLLFQLRTIQSRWYQELFQSSRSPLQGSSNYLWHVCQEMREWSESYPSELSPAIRKLFDLEVLYSYVYCLAPSSRVPAVSEYGKTLIFEYSIAYMQKMFSLSRDPLNPAFITYHDALRVFFIGSQFMAVLNENQDRLLNGVIPYVPLLPGAPPPPPLPSSGRGDNIERSINCISQINDTLKTFGQRWENSKALQSTFESQSHPLLSSLHQRRIHRSDRFAHSQSPPNMSPPMANQIGNAFTDDWNHMGQHARISRDASSCSSSYEQVSYPAKVSKACLIAGDDDAHAESLIRINTRSRLVVTAFRNNAYKKCVNDPLNHCGPEFGEESVGAMILVIVLIAGGIILAGWLVWRFYLHIQSLRTTSRLFVRTPSTEEDGEYQDRALSLWDKVLMKVSKKQPLLPQYSPNITTTKPPESQPPRVPSLVLPNPKFTGQLSDFPLITKLVTSGDQQRDPVVFWGPTADIGPALAYGVD
ncbi:hypothetical protein B7463_g304, partial [Scytalidium lignicola]